MKKNQQKQETLEEASWKYNPLKKLDGEFIRHAFIEGAKWQQKQHLIDMMKGDEELGLYKEQLDY